MARLLELKTKYKELTGEDLAGGGGKGKKEKKEKKESDKGKKESKSPNKKQKKEGKPSQEPKAKPQADGGASAAKKVTRWAEQIVLDCSDFTGYLQLLS